LEKRGDGGAAIVGRMIREVRSTLAPWSTIATAF
jgi:hypothetical protein